MSKNDNKDIMNSTYIENGNNQSFSKTSIFSPLQNVSVETNIRNDNDTSQMNEFFGLAEAGVQTDLTNRDIDELFRSKLCRLNQQELLEFLEAEEQFYQNSSNEDNFLGQKRNKSDDVALSIENKKEEAITVNGNITTNSNSKLDVKKENSNLSVNGATKKPTKKKIDAFFLFKEEYRQMHKIEDEESFEKVSNIIFLSYRSVERPGVNCQKT